MTALRRVLRGLCDLTGWLAMGFLAFLMLGTTLDVIWRSLTGSSLAGVFEFSELAMVMVVFLGTGWAHLDDSHIRVTLLTEMAGPGLRRVMAALGWGTAAAALVILAWPATEEGLYSLSIGEFRWGAVQIPIWWTKLGTAFGLWLAAAMMVLQCLLAVLGRETEPPRRDGLSGPPAH